ncbi:MAG TPA: hypothetical protein VKD90_01810 [Gemmataceae bacterium]|nr:hypothetical protein [Gemmataceae bacterium]
MIPLSPNFPPVHVISKPATVDPASGESRGGSVQEAPNLSLAEATDLLDWLENHQIRPSDVEMDSSGRLTVRWVA